MYPDLRAAFESLAVIVGHRRANVFRLGAFGFANVVRPSRGDPFCPLPYATAVGVGQSASAAARRREFCIFPSRGSGTTSSRPASLAVGVAHSISQTLFVRLLCINAFFVFNAIRFPSVRVGVRHDENPSSEVWSADVGGRKRVGTGVVSASPQVVPHTRHPFCLAARDVFDDDPFRPQLADDAVELDPQSASGANMDPEPFARPRDVGAGEPSAQEIDRFEISGSNCFDVVMFPHLGPVLLQHGQTKVILLDLPRDVA